MRSRRASGPIGPSRGGRARLVVLAVLAIGATACRRRGPEAARLEGARGHVTVQAGDDRAAARPGAALYDGDVVTTGEASGATVAFQGSAIVELGASTALVIRRTGGTATQLGAVLLRGSVHATAKAGPVRFTVGTPFGLAELGGTDAGSEVAVSAHEGIRVLLGDIEVVTADGKRTRLASGATLSAQGLVTLAAPLPDLVLGGNPAQVRVRGARDPAWRAPAGRETLEPGESVRTRRARGTRVEVGDTGAVLLEPDSELKVLDPSRDADGGRLRWELAAGAAVVDVRRRGPRSAAHELRVGSHAIVVEAGLAAAQVEVRAGPGGRALVTVRQGRATLDDGTVVEPGTTATVGSGRPAVRPLASTRVELRAGRRSVVTFSGSTPAVRLACDEVPGGPPYEVEVSADDGFHESVWHEKLAAGTVVLDALRTGRWYWRVRTTGGWTTGSVELEVARDQACASCSRTNVIDDSGESTTVWFQKTLPALTLRWAAAPGASGYRVQVFAHDALDAPLADESVTGTTLALRAGRLAEGRYSWLVRALARDGRELSAGRTNELTVAHDHTAADLEILAPADGARIRASQVVTTGELRQGVRLDINGRSVAPRPDGRFEQSLSLAAGVNQIVYHTVDPSGVERFRVRRVVRR